MSVHEQFAEDLALYALGSLAGQDRIEIEKHVEECGECRRELEQLRSDAALLALSTAGSTPPQRARQRLMSAVHREPRVPIPVPSARRINWWSVLGWATAAAMILVAVLSWKQNADLATQIAGFKNDLARKEAQLEHSNEILNTLTSEDAQRVTLVATKSIPQPQGRAIYLKRKGSLIFLADNLAPLPPQKTYELWLLPITGAAIPAGVFRPDAHGSATMVNPPLPLGVEAKAFAITVEPEAGSGAPTSTPIMLGAGE